MIQWKSLIKNIAIPFLIGGLAAFFTKDAMKELASLTHPPLTPPGWLFPVVWSILYLCMGIATYLLAQNSRSSSELHHALVFYSVQLFYNFCWPLFFFHFGLYWFDFAWLLVLWILIVITLREFYRIYPVSAYLLVPYLCWVTFAGYLNVGIAFLN
jgi:tryptophan-rich sensory protein